MNFKKLFLYTNEKVRCNIIKLVPNNIGNLSIKI